jgi:hypothetical protein
MIKEGAFGRADYFEDLVASVTDMNRGNDWFLLGECNAVRRSAALAGGASPLGLGRGG